MRQLNAETLRVKAEELKGMINHLRYNQYQGKEKNVNKLMNLRHELSRVLTVLAEMEKTSSSTSKS